MDNDYSRAQDARAKAENLRAMAAQETDEKCRKQLLDLAAQYERLCDKMVNRGIKMTPGKPGQ